MTLQVMQYTSIWGKSSLRLSLPTGTFNNSRELCPDEPWAPSYVMTYLTFDCSVLHICDSTETRGVSSAIWQTTSYPLWASSAHTTMALHISFEQLPPSQRSFSCYQMCIQFTVEYIYLAVLHFSLAASIIQFWFTSPATFVTDGVNWNEH